VTTAGSKVHRKSQPGPARRGATSGRPLSVHGPVGDGLVATPIAESPSQPGSRLTASVVFVAV
jgi:hypothetical protein